MKKIDLKQTLLLIFAAVMIGGSLFPLLKPHIRVVLDSGDPGMRCQIFYKKPIPSVYFEKQSRYVTIKKSRQEEHASANFTLPFQTPLDEIRIDLGDKPDVELKIHFVDVEMGCGAFRKRIDAEAIKSAALHNIRLLPSPSSGSGLLLRTGVDPYMVVNTSAALWKFHCSARFSLCIGLFAIGLLILCFSEHIFLYGDMVCRQFRSFVSGLLPGVKWYRRIQPWHCLLGLFFLTVAAGLTGSSIGIIRDYGICEPVGEHKILGSYRAIRSDEYNAHGTASAIQNTICSPRFPVINHNIGLSGRNFLFFHDCGAPVKHPAILLRPATWGFFFLPLRNALAWYWFGPIFFGFLMFYLLMSALFPEGNKWMHFLLSGGLVFSPYAAFWSFWPVNCGAGALGAAALLAMMMRTHAKGMALLLSIAAGWCFAVSAATLYYPHIWPCVFLAIILGAGQILQNFLQPQKDSCSRYWKVTALLLFLAVSAGLLSLFFLAIREPLKIAMLSASGQRIRLGGLFGAWDLIRGWFFYYYDQENNICEMQSYQLILPALGICLLQYWKAVKDRMTCLILFFFGVFILVYQYIGLPEFLAVCIGWSHTTEPRCCYALQIVQFLLLAGFCAVPRSDSNAGIKSPLIFSIFFTFIFLFLMCSVRDWLWCLNPLPMAPLLFGITVFIFGAILFSVMYCVRTGAVIFAVLTGLIGIRFNPLCIAPKAISSPLVQQIKALPGQRFGGRVLLAACPIDSAYQQHFVMGGGKTLNGFFCYEDPVLFRMFFKGLDNAGLFHRLNHMSVSIDRRYRVPFAAEIPQGDCIRLLINGEKYDFSQIPADFLVVSVFLSDTGLEKNKTVQYISKSGEWAIWRIVPTIDNKKQ